MHDEVLLGALGFVTLEDVETLAEQVERQYGEFATNLVDLSELRELKVALIGKSHHAAVSAGTLVRLYLSSEGLEDVSDDFRARFADSFLWLSLASAQAIAMPGSGKPKSLRGAAANFVRHCHDVEGAKLRSRLRSNKAKRYFEEVIEARSVKEGMLELLKKFKQQMWS